MRRGVRTYLEVLTELIITYGLHCDTEGSDRHWKDPVNRSLEIQLYIFKSMGLRGYAPSCTLLWGIAMSTGSSGSIQSDVRRV